MATNFPFFVDPFEDHATFDGIYLKTDFLHAQGADRILCIMPEEQVLTCRMMAKFINEFKYPADNLRILDVGTGCGVFAIYAARLLKDLGANFEIVAIDNNPRAIEFATENAHINGVQGKIDFFPLSIAELRRDFNAFDLILMNAPFNPTPPGIMVAKFGNTSECTDVFKECLGVIHCNKLLKGKGAIIGCQMIKVGNESGEQQDIQGIFGKGQVEFCHILRNAVKDDNWIYSRDFRESICRNLSTAIESLVPDIGEWIEDGKDSRYSFIWFSFTPSVGNSVKQLSLPEEISHHFCSGWDSWKQRLILHQLLIDSSSDLICRPLTTLHKKAYVDDDEGGQLCKYSQLLFSSRLRNPHRIAVLKKLDKACLEFVFLRPYDKDNQWGFTGTIISAVHNDSQNLIDSYLELVGDIANAGRSLLQKKNFLKPETDSTEGETDSTEGETDSTEGETDSTEDDVLFLLDKRESEALVQDEEIDANEDDVHSMATSKQHLLGQDFDWDFHVYDPGQKLEKIQQKPDEKPVEILKDFFLQLNTIVAKQQESFIAVAPVYSFAEDNTKRGQSTRKLRGLFSIYGILQDGLRITSRDEDILRALVKEVGEDLRIHLGPPLYLGENLEEIWEDSKKYDIHAKFSDAPSDLQYPPAFEEECSKWNISLCYDVGKAFDKDGKRQLLKKGLQCLLGKGWEDRPKPLLMMLFLFLIAVQRRATDFRVQDEAQQDQNGKYEFIVLKRESNSDIRFKIFVTKNDQFGSSWPQPIPDPTPDPTSLKNLLLKLFDVFEKIILRDEEKTTDDNRNVSIIDSVFIKPNSIEIVLNFPISNVAKSINDAKEGGSLLHAIRDYNQKFLDGIRKRKIPIMIRQETYQFYPKEGNLELYKHENEKVKLVLWAAQPGS
jgi:tRNA1(Val) A37 N6-methylase TrmN6